MTGFAKRMVRSAIALLQERHGKRNLAFLTVTIPELASADELRQVCGGWGELARRLMEEVGRELTRHGLNPEYCYVNEIQEERWKRDQVPAPHIHAVFQGRITGQKDWAISKEKFREIWERILGNFLGRSMSLPAATRVEVIKKCAKRYMTKYMSKGGKVADEIIAAGYIEFLPGSWHGISNSLRRKVKEGILEVDKDTAYLIVRHLDEYKQAGWVKWYGLIWAVENDGSWHIEYQAHDEQLEKGGQFRMLLSVVGELTSKQALNCVITNSLANERTIA